VPLWLLVDLACLGICLRVGLQVDELRLSVVADKNHSSSGGLSDLDGSDNAVAFN